MNKRQIFFLLLVIVSIFWTIFKAMQPSGGFVPLFFVFLVFTLVSYYFGFVSTAFNPFRFYSQSGAIVFFLLTLLTAYITNINEKGLASITQFIEVYPHIAEINAVPIVSSDTLQHWVLSTEDSLEEITRFYQQPKNLRDWKVISPKPFLVLEKENLILTISFHQQPRSTETNIFYRLDSK